MKGENLDRKFIKVLMCGDGAVGKTTIGQRLAGTLLNDRDRTMTSGIEFHSIMFENHSVIEVQLWDLGGQEQFREFQAPFFDSARIVLLIFAIDRYQTFLGLRSWLPLIFAHEPYKVYLIGNKADLHARAVKQYEIEGFANAHDMVYYEISGLQGNGVEDFKKDLHQTLLTLED